MIRKISGSISASSITGNTSAISSIDGEIMYSDGKGGTSDYEKLINKPKIEGVELIGDITFNQLNLSRVTNSELEDMLKL